MRKILVVDDDPYLVKVLYFRLKMNGYEVMSASNGVEAFAKVRSAKPDMIILDMSMPVMDGYQLVKELKWEDGMKNIPIVVVSGRNEARDLVHELGIKEFISKPYEAAHLINTITQNFN